MPVLRSILAGLLATTAAVSVHAGVSGTVIVEGANGQPATFREYDDPDLRAPDHKRRQTLIPGRGSVPDLSRPQRGLVLIVGPNHQSMPIDAIRNVFEGSGGLSLKSFYERESAGHLTFAPFTYVHLPQPDFNGCPLGPDHQLARYSEATGDKQIDFDHVFVLGADNHDKCPGGTVINVAAATAGNIRVSNKYGLYEFGMTWYTDRFLATEFVLSHEYGHTLGWGHSGHTSRTIHHEYGDAFDLMGSPTSLAYGISAPRKWTLGWTNSVRVLSTSEFGLPVTISRRNGPGLLVLPLAVSRLKGFTFGRTLLAFSFEPELPAQTGPLPFRRAGLVPRVVSPGLPTASLSLMHENGIAGNSQLLADLVLDRVGTYPLSEAGVTIVVDRVDGNSADIRIFDAPEVPSPQLTMHPASDGNGCYHRQFTLTGLENEPAMIAQSQNNGRRELLKVVGAAPWGHLATFVGSGPLVISAIEPNRDGGFTTYNLEAPANPGCTEEVPILAIEQVRQDSLFSRECGLITTTATNLGSASTAIAGYSGFGNWTFQGNGVWNLRNVDPRLILTTHWFSELPFQGIGTTVIDPVDCAGHPVPRLQLMQPEVSATCDTLTLRVNQSAIGTAQSAISLMIQTYGATGQESRERFCNLDGERAGQSYCKVTFAEPVAGREFIMTATTPSDAIALHGVLQCPDNAR